MADLKSLKDGLDCNIVNNKGDILGSYENCLLKVIGVGMQQCTGCYVDLGGDPIVASAIAEVQIYKRGSDIMACAKVSRANNTSLGISVEFEKPRDRSWIERATGLKLQD